MTSLLMVALQPLDCWAKSISQMVGAMSDIVTDYGEAALATYLFSRTKLFVLLADIEYKES